MTSQAHRSYTSAELFIDRAPSTAAPAAAYLVYSVYPKPGHQAATVVDRLDSSWTSSVGLSSGPFGAGEGQLMLRWGTGSSTIYYVLAASTGGCCFCPMGSNSVVCTRAVRALFMHSSGLFVFAQHARFKFYVRASSW